MHISPLEEYGLRCALQLARNPERVTSASAIAEKEGLSVEYVSKLLFLLRKGGIVNAARGTQGGFGLSRPSDQISLQAVFTALNSATGKRDNVDFCQTYSGQKDRCVHSDECSIRPVWEVLSFYFKEVLEALTLSSLLEKEKGTFMQVQSIAANKAGLIQKIFQQPPCKEGIL